MEKTYNLPTKLGFSINAIKIFALTAMFLEHISVFFDKNVLLFCFMRLLGKAAAPIFFFSIVEGYHHTKNKNKYTARLAIFAIISYVPFILCFDGVLNADTFLNFNVIYSLLIGLLVIRVRHEMQNVVLRWMLIGVLFLFACFGDWGYVAPLTILTFDLFYGSRKNQLYAYTLLTILRTELLVKILGPMFFFARYKTVDFSDWYRIGYDIGALIPIAILFLYSDEKRPSGKMMKWSFYVFYPLHLLLIGIAKKYLL